MQLAMVIAKLSGERRQPLPYRGRVKVAHRVKLLRCHRERPHARRIGGDVGEVQLDMLEERCQELIRCADRFLEGAVERRLSLRDHYAVVGQDAQTVAVKVLTEQRLRESYGIRRVHHHEVVMAAGGVLDKRDRKSTRLNSSHVAI